MSRSLSLLPVRGDVIITITTMRMIRCPSADLSYRLACRYIVVDEGHRLKNFNCRLIRELKAIPSDNRLLLSGEDGGGSRGPLGGCHTYPHTFRCAAD